MPPEDKLSLPFLTRKMLDFQDGVKLEIHIESRASVAKNLTVRVLTKEGMATFRHLTTDDGVTKTENYQVADIPIFIGIDSPGLGTVQGTVYIAAYLRVNNDNLVQLLGGPIYDLKGLGWPATNLSDAVPGMGTINNPPTTDPAANTEINETVPAGRAWKLKGVIFTLVADANAANRLVRLDVSNVSERLMSIPAGTLQTANQTVIYNFGVGLPFSNNTTALIQTAPIPNGLILQAGATIKTVTTAIQATDNYGAPSIFVEQFLVSQ